MTEPEITPWDVKQAEFQGFVKSELGNIKDETKAIKLNMVIIDNRSRENDTALRVIRAKAGAYGGAAAALVLGLKWVWGVVS